MQNLEQLLQETADEWDTFLPNSHENDLISFHHTIQESMSKIEASVTKEGDSDAINTLKKLKKFATVIAALEKAVRCAIANHREMFLRDPLKTKVSLWNLAHNEVGKYCEVIEVITEEKSFLKVTNTHAEVAFAWYIAAINRLPLEAVIVNVEHKVVK